MTWVDYHTHGYVYGPDGPEELKESNPDGSCNWCRMEAEANNRCTQCYGRGLFHVEEDDLETYPLGYFECIACNGTGEKRKEN